MPTYEYQAQSADGRVVNGLVFGATLDTAAKQLSGQGMQILRIGVATSANDPLMPSAPRSEQPAPPAAESENRLSGPAIEGPSTEQRSYLATSVIGPLTGKVALTHLAFFFHQLATMLEAGVPYVQSLATLSGQSKSPKLKQIILELRGHLEAGRPISAGMQRYPEVFTPVMISLVRAGEEGGFLDNALTIVANYLDQEIRLRNLYRRVTFYPKLQVAASILIILVANWILTGLNSPMKLSSPLTTWTTYIWLTPLVVGIFLFFRVGLANHAIKFSWDMFTSNLPYLGNTMRQLAMAKFGRAFGALYRGAVPLPKAVKLSADACGNEWIRTLVHPAADKLESGEGISRTLRETGAFSPIVLNMIDTGERTGNLDHMLEKMADFYEDEAGTRSSQTALVMGVVLGLLVAAYILFCILIPAFGGYANEVKSYAQ